MTARCSRLLVVVGDAERRAEIRRLLMCGSDTHYAFAEVDQGATAIRLIRAAVASDDEDDPGMFDCVLLDCSLPDMEALEVLSALGDPAVNLPCPVLVLTGSERGLGTRLVNAGAQDYLGRDSVTSESLTHAVDNAIDRFALLARHARVERELRLSEARYRSLFEGIDAGFCIIRLLQDEHDRTVDFEYLEVNPGFALATGLANAAGRRAKQLMPTLEPVWLERYARVAATGEPERFVEQVADLDHRWFDVYAMRLDALGRHTVAVLFTDVSERIRIESALNAAVAAAETANRAKTEFLSNMSHELRSPLNAILGFAQLMECNDPVPTGRQRESLDQILKAGWYLLELVNQILDLAVIESGRPSIDLETLSLGDVLHDCKAMMAPLALQRGIRLDFPPGTPLLLHADPMRLKQVFVNLLSNAIKYNRPGGQVRVTCNRCSATRLRVSVEDTGNGLTPDQLAHLFEPFQRLGQESRGIEGTGIGLVVSKRLVELMGGAIGAESRIGHGSAFWVEFETPPSASPGDHASEPAVRPTVAPPALLLQTNTIDPAAGATIFWLPSGRELKEDRPC